MRSRFESVISQYNFLVQQIIRKDRQSKRAYVSIKDYYVLLMEIILENPTYSNEVYRRRNKKE